MVTALRIVLVEDHDALREVTAVVLREAGHHVTALGCAEDLTELPPGGTVDIFILDLNLPGEDGISLAQRLRESQPLVGIIMTTARSAGEQIASGYAHGADMYLVKPITPQTLLAAVESLARRLRPVGTAGLQLASHTLTLSGPAGTATLLPIEATLLIEFARAPQRRLETWQIAEWLNQPGEGASKTAVEVRLSRLRKKLIDCGASANCIRSVRAIGYQLYDPIQIL